MHINLFIFILLLGISATAIAVSLIKAIRKRKRGSWPEARTDKDGIRLIAVDRDCGESAGVIAQMIKATIPDSPWTQPIDHMVMAAEFATEKDERFSYVPVQTAQDGVEALNRSLEWLYDNDMCAIYDRVIGGGAKGLQTLLGKLDTFGIITNK